jgi:hypothetical protein
MLSWVKSLDQAWNHSRNYSILVCFDMVTSPRIALRLAKAISFFCHKRKLRVFRVMSGDSLIWGTDLIYNPTRNKAMIQFIPNE